MTRRFGLRLTALWQHNLLPKIDARFHDHAVPATLTCSHADGKRIARLFNRQRTPDPAVIFADWLDFCSVTAE